VGRMTQVSKIKLNPELKNKLIKKLWFSISSMRSREEVEEFFSNFLTRTEVEMLAKRLEVQKELIDNDKVIYRQLGLKLRLSPITIATHKRLLRRSSKLYKDIVRRLKKY